MSEWIKTSERLPETEEDVLILLDGKYFDIARYWQVCDMDGPEWCYRLRDEFPLPITHWMPLPEKPEIKKAEQPAPPSPDTCEMEGEN